MFCLTSLCSLYSIGSKYLTSLSCPEIGKPVNCNNYLCNNYNTFYQYCHSNNNMARSGKKKPLGYYKEVKEKKDLEVDDLCDEGVF